MEIDKNLVRERFAHSFKSYDAAAVIQRSSAEQLVQSLLKFLPEYKVRSFLEIGIGTGFLTRQLMRLFPDALWYLNDIASEAFTWLPEREQTHVLLGDAEKIVFPQELELIASSSAIQWFDDIAAFIQKVYSSLVSGGIFAFTSFGPNNFLEIKHILNFGLNYPSLENLVQIGEACGFQLLHSREWQKKLYFDSPKSVLQHIKKTGANGLRNESWSKERLEKFSQAYTAAYSDDNNKVFLSYHPVEIILKKI